MMRMKNYLPIGLATLLAVGMNSCILDPDPLPEMPYRPRKVTESSPQPVEQPIETTSWEDAPATSGFITPSAAVQPAPQSKKQPTGGGIETAVASVPVPAPQPAQQPTKPEPKPESKPELDLKPESAAEPQVIKLPAVSSTTQTTEIKGETPSPAPSPTPAAPATIDLKQITNTGPIPTAARVEGDPTRVWNPLDPSKKIRIINPKTNQPYPSGKKLKVRGTNFQFYVP